MLGDIPANLFQAAVTAAAGSAAPMSYWVPIISALGAASITLIGVALLNHGNNKRQAAQLEHDRRERQKERVAQMRRDLYTTALTEVQRVQLHLIRLPSMDLTRHDVSDGFNGFFEAAAKIQLVADPATTLAVNQLVHAYGEIPVALTQVLLTVGAARDEAERAKKTVKRIGKDLARLEQALAAELESGSTTQPRTAALQQQITVRRREQHDALRLVAAKLEAHRRVSEPFNEQLYDMLTALTGHQFVVLDALRADLGIGGDLTDLRAAATRQIESTRVRMRKVLQAIDPH